MWHLKYSLDGKSVSLTFAVFNSVRFHLEHDLPAMTAVERRTILIHWQD